MKITLFNSLLYFSAHLAFRFHASLLSFGQSGSLVLFFFRVEPEYQESDLLKVLPNEKNCVWAFEKSRNRAAKTKITTRFHGITSRFLKITPWFHKITAWFYFYLAAPMVSSWRGETFFWGAILWKYFIHSNISTLYLRRTHVLLWFDEGEKCLQTAISADGMASEREETVKGALFWPASINCGNYTHSRVFSLVNGEIGLPLHRLKVKRQG